MDFFDDAEFLPVGVPAAETFSDSGLGASVQDLDSQSEPEHVEGPSFDSAGWLVTTTPQLEGVADIGPENFSGSLPEEGYDETGFLKISWVMDQSAIEGSLIALGLVGPRLAIQAGDEHVLLEQLIRQLGISMEWQQKRWHLEKLFYLVQTAVDRNSLAKRMRGDHYSTAQQILLDRMSMDRTTARFSPPIVVPNEFVIPPKGQRRNRQLASLTNVTQQEQEELDKKRYLAGCSNPN